MLPTSFTLLIALLEAPEGVCIENEDLMQAGHIQESVLPGAVRSQAEQDEAQLVKASQHGDQDAFALLVRRHQPRIFNLSMGRYSPCRWWTIRTSLPLA
jgi:hypothetical protein